MPTTLPPSDQPENVTKDRSLWRSALAVGSLPRRGLRVLSGQGAREGYLAAVDQGAISIANFAATIILARAITPTDLGVYGVGFTALRLVRSVQEGLTIQPINAYGAGMDAENFRRYAIRPA